MPHRVVKRKGTKPYKIIREFPNGTTQTVGSSRSRTKAKMSAGIRDSEEQRGRLI